MSFSNIWVPFLEVNILLCFAFTSMCYLNMVFDLKLPQNEIQCHKSMAFSGLFSNRDAQQHKKNNMTILFSYNGFWRSFSKILLSINSRLNFYGDYQGQSYRLLFYDESLLGHLTKCSSICVRNVIEFWKVSIILKLNRFPNSKRQGGDKEIASSFPYKERSLCLLVRNHF